MLQLPWAGGGRLYATLALLTTDGVLVALYLGQAYVDVPSGMLTRLVDLDGEASVCMWYSSMKLGGIGVLLALVAYGRTLRKTAGALVLALLALMFVALSLDEAVQIHEWLGWLLDGLLAGASRVGTIWSVTGVWMFVLGLPFSVLAFYLLHVARRCIPADVAGWLTTGMAVLLAGALGAETFANLVAADASVAAVSQIAIEEALEMGGATLMFGAALRLVHAEFEAGATREALAPVGRTPAKAR